MRYQPIACLLLALLVLLQPLAGFAFETDQFNLPPKPLAEIGDEVSDYVAANLRTAAREVNAEIEKSERCLENAKLKLKGCGSHDAELKRLSYLRSNDALSFEVFKRLGDGSIFVSKFGKWIKSFRFHAQPSSYKTTYLESIYVTLPSNYLTISPTVRLYGTEFGIDKLEHFFQQGYKYYKIQAEAVSKGEPQEKAETKAVKWGQKSERTYYGLLVSGVYSNADLYSNYAGMRFYQGLTREIRTGESTRPATTMLQDGNWQVSDDGVSADNLIKPFLTDHLNEALNPSGYTFDLYTSVRDIVTKNTCTTWRQKYPGLTAADLRARSTELELWNDEDYGNMVKGRMVKIGDLCFE